MWLSVVIKSNFNVDAMLNILIKALSAEIALALSTRDPLLLIELFAWDYIDNSAYGMNIAYRLIGLLAYKSAKLAVLSFFIYTWACSTYKWP